MNKAKASNTDRCQASSTAHYEYQGIEIQPGSALICCKLAPYVLSLCLHMNDSGWQRTQKGRLWGGQRGWISMIPLYWVPGRRDRMGLATHASVICWPVRREGEDTGDRETAGCPTSPNVIHCVVTPHPQKTCPWLITTTGQTPGLRQERTVPLGQYLLCHPHTHTSPPALTHHQCRAPGVVS